MKSILTVLASLLLCVGLHAEGDTVKYNMVVYKNDGTNVAISVNDISRVVWEKDTLKPSPIEPVIKMNVITGIIDNGGGTKTSITPDYNLVWNKGDYILVKNEYGVYERYWIVKGTETNTGTFSNFKEDGFDYQDDLTAFYGLIEKEKEVYWVQDQVYKKGYYGVIPMWARSRDFDKENPELKFKPMGGLLKLRLTGGGEKIKEICLDVSGSATLGGVVYYGYEKPEFFGDCHHLSLRIEEIVEDDGTRLYRDGITLTDEPAEFDIFLPEGDYETPVFSFYDEQGKIGELRSDKTLSIKSSMIYNVSRNLSGGTK